MYPLLLTAEPEPQLLTLNKLHFSAISGSDEKLSPVPPALVIFNCHFDMPSGHLEGDQLRNSLDQIASGQVGDYLDCGLQGESQAQCRQHHPSQVGLNLLKEAS